MPESFSGAGVGVSIFVAAIVSIWDARAQEGTVVQSNNFVKRKPLKKREAQKKTEVGGVRWHRKAAEGRCGELKF
jgi:uncharacterized low-complexity protein